MSSTTSEPPRTSVTGQGGRSSAAAGASSAQAGSVASASAGAGSPAGKGGSTGAAGASASGTSAGAGAAPSDHFSFFVTSLRAMRMLSGSQDGFGGDLRFGETGAGAGLRGADKICTTIAEQSLKGAGAKQWRAFLSATKGADGAKVNAIDRIGEGPWYDRTGRLVASSKAELMSSRPTKADASIKNDLPNEDGTPNHNPDGTGEVDNHDVLTGSNGMGQLAADDPKVTCADWTKNARDSADSPQVGHSWSRGGGPGGGGRPTGSGGPSGAGSALGGGYDPVHWIESHAAPGCGAGVGLVESAGAPNENNPTVGEGGGYGAIYCFALQP